MTVCNACNGTGGVSGILFRDRRYRSWTKKLRGLLRLEQVRPAQSTLYAENLDPSTSQEASDLRRAGAREPRSAVPVLDFVRSIGIGLCLLAWASAGTAQPFRTFVPGSGRFVANPGIARGFSAPLNAGEVTSTVVPPGKKGECPAGRLLISNDNAKNPGLIWRTDLNNLSSGMTTIPEPLPAIQLADGRPDREIASNDHDLVALPNGDVVLAKLGRARTPLSPQPAWFDHAYKLTDGSAWGPGARSVVYVWRSEDCGETFELRSTIDTASLNDGWGTATDGSAGMPQLPNRRIALGDGEYQVVYQMGGTDGPLLAVEPRTGILRYTLGVVGHVPEAATDKPFALTAKGIHRSVVVTSTDNGDTWHHAMNLDYHGWRQELPFLTDRYWRVFRSPDGDETRVNVLAERPEHLQRGDAWDRVVLTAPEPQAPFGWDRRFDNSRPLAGFIGTNVPHQPILVRSPESDRVILLYADTIRNHEERSVGDGYRAYVFHYGQWFEMPPIVPKNSHPDSLILHPTLIDAGQGPLLVYWYDFDAASSTAEIRGRLLTSNFSWRGDFGISDSFSLTQRDWYGDYHTAGGIRLPQPTPEGYEYEFYPVWVQPGGKTHFARVSYAPPRVPERPEENLLHDRLIPKKRLDVQIRHARPNEVLVEGPAGSP